MAQSVRKHHSFFWDTELSPERMEEISEWIGSLKEQDKRKLADLLADVRLEEKWEAAAKS